MATLDLWHPIVKGPLTLICVHHLFILEISLLNSQDYNHNRHKVCSEILKHLCQILHLGIDFPFTKCIQNLGTLEKQELVSVQDHNRKELN